MVAIRHTELDIFPFVLSTSTFGTLADANDVTAILDEFVASGGNCIDTSAAYAQGEAERLVGLWREDRDDDTLVITSALNHGLGSGAAVRQAVDTSRERLGVESVDILYVYPDDAGMPVEDLVSTASALVDDSYARHIGLIGDDIAAMRSFFAAAAQTPARPVVIQPEYSLLQRLPLERDFAPLAKQYSAAVIPRFALASGLLTGKYRSEADIVGAARERLVRGYLTGNTFNVVRQLDRIADNHDTEVATVALAWMLAKGVTAPQASVSCAEQLPALMATPKLKLSTDEIAYLDAASAPIRDTRKL